MLLRIIIIILEGAKCNKNLWDHAAVSPASPAVTLTAGVTAYSIRVVFDPAGMNPLAYLFRRNESASGFNPPG